MSRAIERIWGSTRHSINYIPQNPHNPASLVCLCRNFQKKDNTRFSHIKMMKIRQSWMDQQEIVYGIDNLTCSLCGKTGLSPRSLKISNLATLDHIIPIAKDHHRWNDPTNFQVACYSCNSRKGS